MAVEYDGGRSCWAYYDAYLDDILGKPPKFISQGRQQAFKRTMAT
jgi:hypothetical protein